MKRRPFDPWLEDEAALDRSAPSRRSVLIVTLSVLLLALFVIAVVLLAIGIGELMEYLSPDPESH